MSTNTFPDVPATGPGKPDADGSQDKAAKPGEAGASTTPGTGKRGIAAKPGKAKRIALVIAAVVLFGGGVGTGTALTDPTASDEYAALAADKASVEAERDGLQDDYDGLREDHDMLAADIADREAGIEERAADLEQGEADLKDAEAAVKKREKAVSGAEKEKADNTIHEGTWTVGVDIAAGTYRTTDTVSSTCYWGIYRTGSNGDDIITNDIPGGGRPMVTLSKGQDFNTTRCGTWEKQ